MTEAGILRGDGRRRRRVCPGAAAALVDWGGAEIARLRAFGIVHGVVLRHGPDLGLPPDHGRPDVSGGVQTIDAAPCRSASSRAVRSLATMGP